MQIVPYSAALCHTVQSIESFGGMAAVQVVKRGTQLRIAIKSGTPGALA